MNDTPKQFVMQLGAIVSAYVTLIAFLLLCFSLIDLFIPDFIESYWEVESAGSSARTAIAFLIVSTPTVVYLTRQIQRLRNTTTNIQYAPLMRWLVYLSLFLGSAVLLGYVVGIIVQFLNGELSLRFILKALVASSVIGAAMWYYLKDSEGYWEQHPQRLQQVGWALLGTITVVILVSFTIINSPATVREIRIDQEQVQTLREVEWRIESHLDNNAALPESIATLYQDDNVPQAPATRDPYSFRFTNDSYELCATFAEPNPATYSVERPQPKEIFTATNRSYTINDYGSWNYEPGRHCFARTVVFSTSTDNN